MKDLDKLHITQSAEYKAYIAALCELASNYVAKIRRQFAEKAFDNYQNEAVRSLVLAYGAELEKLRADRLRDFTWVADDPEAFGGLELDDSCLNKAQSYADAIKFLFDIK